MHKSSGGPSNMVVLPKQGKQGFTVKGTFVYLMLGFIIEVEPCLRTAEPPKRLQNPNAQTALKSGRLHLNLSSTPQGHGTLMAPIPENRSFSNEAIPIQYGNSFGSHTYHYDDHRHQSTVEMIVITVATMQGKIGVLPMLLPQLPPSEEYLCGVPAGGSRAGFCCLFWFGTEQDGPGLGSCSMFVWRCCSGSGLSLSESVV